MCGICGVITKRNIQLNKLVEMNNLLYHRGPDDHGEELYSMPDGYLLGLAQRRLSILDLSVRGHQPMHSPNGRISVVFNGEIYNYLEIKKELPEYRFVSDCDTEVIIAAYLKWGIECVHKFNGMFAIALYDRDCDTLYLVRDRIGEKPLYYSLEEEELFFASELKPIVAAKKDKLKINKDCIGSFLVKQYIESPYTIYENVYKLYPGEIVSFRQGKLTKKRYWTPYDAYLKAGISKNISYEEAKDEFKRLLIDSIRIRMISDVPLGTFLSGGYDSSLVSAIAQQLSSKPIKTFCIGFEDERFNEAEYAKEISKYIGTDHAELYIREKELIDCVSDMVYYYDEPFADNSLIATMAISKLARKDVTVALSGDGGDELFCGYKTYDYIETAKKLDVLGAAVNAAISLPGLKTTKLVEGIPEKICIIAGNRDKDKKTQFFLTPYQALVTELLIQNKGVEARYSESRYDIKNWQFRRMILDQETYLPDDILCKVDRASMKYSLETRCPILDYRIIEFANSLPHKYKYHGKTLKRLLKDVTYDFLPREMLDRPKTGFAVPIKKWLCGELKEQLWACCDSRYLIDQALFDPKAVNRFVKEYYKGTYDRKGIDYSGVIWAFFVFQMWYKANVK